MNYIHYFDTETNHNSVYKSSNYTEPWVAYIEENKKCTYNDRRPYLMGTATSTFEHTEGAFKGYTFTSPSFKVIYTGDTLTDLSNAFEYETSLSSITESTLDTSNVTDMSDMFSNCHALKTLDLSNWKTSKVTDMSYMFQICLNLTTLDLSNWNTSKVTNMNSMFYHCSNLTTVKVTNCSSETQNKILTQLKYDLKEHTWTLNNGVITRSNKS